MAYTSTDLVNIRAAIAAIIARMATGDPELISMTKGDKSFQYEPTCRSLQVLRAMEVEAYNEVGLAAGTFRHRTYARQGGRGI